MGLLLANAWLSISFFLLSDKLAQKIGGISVNLSMYSSTRTTNFESNSFFFMQHLITLAVTLLC